VLSNVAPPSLRRKVATDNVLQIIKAHPNWPEYADVFVLYANNLHLAPDRPH